MKKVDYIELIAIAGCLIFAVAISLYHIADKDSGYLGLSISFWRSVWAIAENSFSLLLVIMMAMGMYLSSLGRKMFKYVFTPYFAMKLIYHFSCYSGWYLFSEDRWEKIWSAILVILIISGLGYFLFLMKKSHA
jgi:hypothetical protein